MAKELTTLQKELLDKLTRLSNMVSNAVYIAENTEESDVDKQIDLGIWVAKHFISEIEDIKRHSAVLEGARVESTS